MEEQKQVGGSFISFVISPFQKFFRIESAGGLLLFGSTILALIWANSPYSSLYEKIKNLELGFSVHTFELSKPLILWINDGLMAIFFFLIGLEIKRELFSGELSEPRKAAFPLLAALGGMSVPALLFYFFNKNPEASAGWGIPMATDIAFSLAILKVLGNRVPLSLKIFLTAFAIVDDLGAILVIALFYSTGIKWGLIAIGCGVLGFLLFLSYRKYFRLSIIIFGGLAAWFLFLKGGIHPTLAGVVLAFAVPISQKINFKTFKRKFPEFVEKISSTPGKSDIVLSREQKEQIDDLNSWIANVRSPLQHLEDKLHAWVAFGIMPIFALFNAGIGLSDFSSLDSSLMIVLAMALILGNLIGVLVFSALGITMGICEKPMGLTNYHLVGASLLAGVGFTMSVFIATLAYAGQAMLLDSAKAGILAGSLIAGLAGYMVLRFAPERTKPELL
jgi:Na+:H+ antiporter, NhaA family